MDQKKQWWVVEGGGELLGITDDLEKAEAALRGQFMEDFPEANEDALGFDLKFGDWYLFSAVSRQRLRDYSARKADVL